MKSMNFTIQLLLAILLSFSLFQSAYGQDSIPKHPEISIRYSLNFNKQILHHAALIALKWKRHSVFLGPEYSVFHQEKPISTIVYNQQAVGALLGYRYSIYEYKKTKFFCQLAYSMYQLNYREYQLGPPFFIDRKKMRFENSLSIGIEYSIMKPIQLFAGLGLYSMDGFILNNPLFPNTMLGIQVRI